MTEIVTVFVFLFIGFAILDVIFKGPGTGR
jgi:hypothetical protein